MSKPIIYACRSTWSRARLCALVLVLAFGSAPGLLADELVVNGSFELPLVTHESGWMSYYGENAPPGYCESIGGQQCQDGTLIPGWAVFWTDTLGTGNLPGRLEIQTGAISGITAKSGDQKAELDSHYREGGSLDHNVTIIQMMQTCARTGYTFRYSWKPRTTDEGDSDMLVLIDNEVLFANTAINDDWTTEEYHFIANDSGLSGLGFRSIGTGNTLGMLLDDVSVQGLDGSVPENCAPVLDAEPCASKPAVLEMLYDADLDGQDFHAQDPNEVVVDTYTADALPRLAKIKVFDHKKVASELFNGTVRFGETFSITGTQGKKRLIPPRIIIEIYTADTEELLQTVVFHTSCSQPLNVGDEFGGVAVWGMTP